MSTERRKKRGGGWGSPAAAGLLLLLLTGCPRETESPFYGGQPVRPPFGDAQPATQNAPEKGERGGPPSGVLEGATQPGREDKAPAREEE